MNDTTTCPGPVSLQEYLLGRMSEAMAADVERHLASCPGCRKGLPTIRAEDDFVADFRAHAGRARPRNAFLDRLACDLRDRLLPDAPTFHNATPPADGDVTPAPVDAAADETDDLRRLLAPSQGPDELGRLGDYRVLKVLGSGGMGVVFLAEDARLRRRVAVKVMRPSLATSAKARERFLREARLTASITHDNVIVVHQVGEQNGVPFLAMPLLQGESLDARLKREGRLPLAEVLRIGRETAEGLAAAHEHGLIHRDVKPANLWLEALPGGRYRVKVLDFGLARPADGDGDLTQTGVVVGTPAYMAPEQARGEKVDARGDLFSLGCVLYKLCTGATPFAGDSAMAIFAALATARPKPPRDLNPDVSTELSDLVMRLLEKEPARRPQSAGEVIPSLLALALPSADEGRATPPVPAAPAAPAPGSGRKRRPWVMAAAAAGFLAAAVTAAVVVIHYRDKDGKQQEIRVDVPGQVVGAPAVERTEAAPSIPTGEPMSALALVQRPAKIAGVQSWTVEPNDRIKAPPVDPLLDRVVVWSKGFLFTRLAHFGDKQNVYYAWDTTSAKFIQSGVNETRSAPSPDGKLLAVERDDFGVDLLDFATGKLIRSLKGGTEQIITLRWSADGKRLVSRGRASGKTIVWDVLKEKPLLTLDGNEENEFARMGVALSPDGRTVALANHGEGLRLVDCETGQTIAPKFELPDKLRRAVLEIAWSPDGKAMAGSEDGGGSIWIWPIDGTQTARKLVKNWGGLAWSPDSKKLAIGNHMGVWIVSVESGQIAAVLLSIRAEGSVALSAEGDFITTPEELGKELVYVVQTKDGATQTLTPDEMFKKYGWKNDPSRVRLWGE